TISDSRYQYPYKPLATAAGVWSYPSKATAWAEGLIEVYNTDLIASPILIEFLCGVENGADLVIRLAYLKPFRTIDEGSIPRDDWKEAERIAKRVPPRGGRRKLGDCLIKAISERLNCDVVTADSDFERRIPPRP